ncbi:hypothetical protein NPIL_474841, partial [Nephila pilipes]
SVLTVKNGGS